MQRDPHIHQSSPAAPSKSQGSMDQAFFGPSVHDVDIDGLELEEAAATLGIGADDLWRRIRNGQVLARSQQGKVFVYTNLKSAEMAQPKFQGATSRDLPTIPSEESSIANQIIVTQMEASLTDASITQSLAVANREISLLIDHLSLAKDESRDIISFTRESMTRLTEMTDTMLQMKDEVISAREQQVEMLQERIRAQTEELKAALREKENLETLTKTLMPPEFD